MFRLPLIASVVLPMLVWGAEPSSIDRVESDGSPQNDILIQYCFVRDGGEQIWLASNADFSKRHFLFTNERNAKVLFADDEDWLALNDHWGSNGSSVLLFKRAAQLDYRKQGDISAQAWDFFTEHQHIAQPSLDHRYIEAILWVA